MKSPFRPTSEDRSLVFAPWVHLERARAIIAQNHPTVNRPPLVRQGLHIVPVP